MVTNKLWVQLADITLNQCFGCEHLVISHLQDRRYGEFQMLATIVEFKLLKGLIALWNLELWVHPMAKSEFSHAK